MARLTKGTKAVWKAEDRLTPKREFWVRRIEEEPEDRARMAKMWGWEACRVLVGALDLPEGTETTLQVTLSSEIDRIVNQLTKEK